MKKILIITYYWPPAGGPGVQRWLKFVKYLPEFEIEPIIYTPENPTYPYKDASLLREVDPQLTILKKNIFEPYQIASAFSKKQTQQISSGIITDDKSQSKLQKALLYIRGNFFIPDARVFWVRPSVNYLVRYLNKNDIDTVITTGPPHSMHLIGQRLKELLPIKWIADFRDPWTGMWYFDQLKLSTKSKERHHRLERSVLQQADLVLTTSRVVQKEFQQLTTSPVKVLTNGYDGEISPLKTELDQKFSISHIGSFFSVENLNVLWEALAELVAKEPEFKKHFTLRLIGKNNPELHQALAKYKLGEYTEDLGYLTHNEVLQYQKRTQVLLLQYTNEQVKGIVPGKLFEYLKASRPILAIGPSGWEVQEIIQTTKSGYCFSFTDKVALIQQIKKLFKAYLKQDLFVDSVDIDTYHRRNLTARLSGYIKSL